MKWQPIETAPKDGTPIDLWVPGFADPVDCRYAGACWDDKQSVWVDYLNGDPFEFDDEPSHWMPLPDAPND